MKFLSDFSYKMPHLFLFLGVTWTLCRPTYPLSTTKPTLATPNDANEYDYSEDPESPGQINKPASVEQNPSSPKPYFEQNTTTVYAKLNESVKLDCPVKNYSNSKHNLMWYKDNSPISNGDQALQETYQLETIFNLTIKSISNDTVGNYSCSVLPDNVRYEITVKIDDKPNMKDTGSTASIPVILMLLCLTILSFSLQHIPLNNRRDGFMLNY